MTEYEEEIKKSLPTMIDKAYNALKTKAQVGISGCKNGACLFAVNKDGQYAIFEGCNIELSTSTVIHAERLALFHAIMKGYTRPIAIVLNTPNTESIPMCCYCRQDYMYVNPNLKVYTVNIDKKITGEFILRDTIINPYMSKGKLNHEQ